MRLAVVGCAMVATGLAGAPRADVVRGNLAAPAGPGDPAAIGMHDVEWDHGCAVTFRRCAFDLEAPTRRICSWVTLFKLCGGRTF